MSYTIPHIYKGEAPVHTPKGSNLDKELAKNKWYINFTYNGKQYREKKGINRIKDPIEKKRWAEALRLSLENRLKDGYNPEHPEEYAEQLTKQRITLAEAVQRYLTDLSEHATKNSVDSYKSKLRHLVDAFPDKQVKDIRTKDIENYIRTKIRNDQPDKMFVNGRWITEDNTTQWTQGTVNAAKGIFRAFFNWCKKKDQGYITENPITEVEQKKIRSTVKAPDTNIPYTNDDLKTVMAYLDEHDPYTAFFCRFIYSTCLRPREITQLQLRDINMERQQITVRLDVMKTTRKTVEDIIDIEPNFYKRLESFRLEQYPPNFYIVSKDEENIVGREAIDPEKPYKRLVEQALKTLKLHKKGYTLYSFKHTSNIRRFNNGWSLAEIMKANRHTDLQSTLEYLKNITRTTDISQKEVPAI
jgi:integrase